jgi:glycosyltransferase involved in cell wall biosynthesis
MPKVVVVVPCYNEERRLDADQVLTLLHDPSVHLLFVDDGSRDGTRALLTSIAASHPERVAVLALEKNSGKAEAVRRGLLDGLERGATIVGYLDADLATPPEEMQRMLDEMRRTGAKVVLGARVRLLGRAVERHAMRHYLGRVFATLASLVLRLNVYDTQCGAKLLSDGPALRFALESPFHSRWAFDVELFKRLLLAPVEAMRPEQFLETPLVVWRDKAGSKLTSAAMLKAGLDLLRIALLTREDFVKKTELES